MDDLSTIAVAIPLIGATGLLAVAPVLPWRARHLSAVAVAAATTAVLVVLATADQLLVHWFGGWAPVRGLAIGVGFVVDPIGAGTAALAAFLAAAAFVFSWRYFEAVGALYHTLMLLFTAGMVGFALTGDLFNLFVFFELLTTSAYALTAYHIEQRGPLQGSLNFAVTNTIGAFLLLHGIGFLYGRTGALNLAEIGRALATASPDATLLTAFLLISVGLFIKAAIIPFHFWLPDAHAVAPSSVSVLLSGVMIQLGLYGWARVYWTVFAGPFGGHAHGLRSVILVLGAATAILGGVMALAQFQLKRLLAFSSVSHAGLILIGVGLLDAHALAGAGLYTLSHGAIKGALFLLVGILLYQHNSVKEAVLRGRGRRQPVTAAAFVIAGLALAGLPPFGTALGRQLIEEPASHHGFGWIAVVFLVAEVLTAGAVLRAAGRVFLGWGPVIERDVAEDVEDEAPPDRVEEGEERHPGRAPAVMVGPAVVLVVAALLVGVWPPLAQTAVAAAERFVDPVAYHSAVLDAVPHPLPAPSGSTGLSGKAALLGLTASVAAAATALVALFRDRVPSSVRAPLAGAVEVPLGVLRGLQSGHVGDYVAWLILGAAVLGGTYLLVLL
ncbi:MAG: NADH-quinone oxidoreductase subunit D [Actinomycetota bacterium]|nr:NADH-quinone oxidoreductase subunit D [Actinomycetota bacterium]